MALDLFPTLERRALGSGQFSFVDELDPGFAGALSASVRAFMAAQNEVFIAGLRREILEEIIEPYRRATGDNLANPMNGPPPETRTDPRTFFTPAREIEDEYWTQGRQRLNAWAAATGNALFPTDEELDRLVYERRLAIHNEAEQTLSGARSGGAIAGSFIGGFLGALSDPIVAGSMALGAPWAAGVIRTFLLEAGIGFASDLVAGTVRMGTRQEVDPDYGFGDVVGQALITGAGAGILGGGIKGLARAWTRFRRAAPDAPLPDAVRDAGIILERDDAFRPRFPLEPADEAAYAARIDALEREFLATPVLRSTEGQATGRFADEVAATIRLLDDKGDELLPSPRLQAEPIVELTTTRLPEEPAERRAAIAEIVATARQSFAGTTVRNIADGSEIIIGARGLKASVNGSSTPLQIAATGHLDRLLARAMPAGSAPDRFGRPGIAAIHSYEATVALDGVPAVARLQVHETRDGRRYFDRVERADIVRPRRAGDRSGSSPSPAGMSGAVPVEGYGQAFESLRPEVELRLGPDAIAKAVDESEVADVTFHRLDQLLAEDPARTIDWPAIGPDGAEVIVRRPLRDVLAEFEEREIAAREIGACLVGRDA